MINLILKKIFFYFNSYIILIMVRIFALFSVSSVFNNKSITISTKILLAYNISILIFPLFFHGKLIKNDTQLFFLLIYQILVGGLIGFLIQCFFTCINLTGEIISTQIGLSNSVFFDSNVHVHFSFLSYFLNIFLFLFFYFLDGHIWLIKILIKSFNIFPINYLFFDQLIFFSLVRFANTIFFSGLLLSLPILFFLLIIQIILAILNRIFLQMSLLSIFFPITLILGILLLKPFVLFLCPMLLYIFQYFFKNLLIIFS